MAVESSIIIEFADDVSDSSQETVVVELDPDHSSSPDNFDQDSDTGEYTMKSSFPPDGNPPTILVHHGSNLVIDTVRTSIGATPTNGFDGIPTGDSRRQRTIEKDQIVFTQDTVENSQNSGESVGYAAIVTDSLSIIKYYGNVITTSDIDVNGQYLKPKSTFTEHPCIFDCDFKVEYQGKYVIEQGSDPVASGESFPVVTVIRLKSATS